MASETTALMQYAQSKMSDAQWEDALKNIFLFVRHYVPNELFDLEKAAPQQIKLLQAVQDGKRYFIIRAPRKGGKTICVAIIAVWLTLRNQKYRFFILSGSLYQAEWLYDYCRKILWPGGVGGVARREFFSQFLVGEPTKSRIVYKTGGWIRYTAASSKQVNAPTADGQAMDEFVLIPKNIVEEAWPMIRSSEDPIRFILSTATPGKENTDAFLDMLADAQDLGFEKIEWEEKDCPFLQTKRAKEDSRLASYILSEDMFRTQYLGHLPKGAGRIFPSTFIRRAFVAPDKEKPGFLRDGTPYDPEKLEFRGERKGSIDWGYDHDTAMFAGYRGLNKKIVIMKLKIENNTSATDWAKRAEDLDKDHGIHEWYCDAAGAFENRALEDKGLAVIRRPFQSKMEGKEWMIGVTYYWLEGGFLIIPDIPNSDFEIFKRQMTEYRRGEDGKPVKKFDNAVDGFLLLLSGWDPAYYAESKEASKPQTSMPRASANDWETYRSAEDQWLPDDWRSRKEELTKFPWAQ